MLEKVKQFKELAGLVAVIAAAILWFTPMSYSKETREMVVEMGLKDQLNYFERKAWEFKKECTNLKTGEWLCSDEDKIEYEGVLIEIKLLKKKLGVADG